jgi:hypothetical protein
MTYKDMRPLVRASFKPSSDAEVAKFASKLQIPIEEARIALELEAACEVWINDIYQVQVRPHTPPCVQLNIRRRDGDTIFRDFRHFQQIKNQLLGAECEAVELYPAESRLVDSSNKYHLWGVPNPGYRFPFGFKERDVQDAVERALPGMRQRKL